MAGHHGRIRTVVTTVTGHHGGIQTTTVGHSCVNWSKTAIYPHHPSMICGDRYSDLLSSLQDNQLDRYRGRSPSRTPPTSPRRRSPSTPPWRISPGRRSPSTPPWRTSPDVAVRLHHPGGHHPEIAVSLHPHLIGMQTERLHHSREPHPSGTTSHCHSRSISTSIDLVIQSRKREEPVTHQP